MSWFIMKDIVQYEKMSDLMKSYRNIPLEIWILSLVILLTPILTATVFENKIEVMLDNDTAEMIWLITLFPSVLFSYYKGLRGGLFIAAIAMISNCIIELREVFQTQSFHLHDLRISIMGLLLHLSIVISVGVLAEKLKYKEAELIRLNKKYEDLSYIDELTGLNNRRGFFKKGNQLMINHPYSVCLFIDLDEFKPINDQFGHELGDELLKIIAKRLIHCLREIDIVGRLGGDEFICFLADLDPKNAEQIVSRMITSISTPIIVAGYSLAVTASIGMAISPSDGKTIEELLKSADAAMYEAKKKGKNSYFLFGTS